MKKLDFAEARWNWPGAGDDRILIEHPGKGGIYRLVPLDELKVLKTTLEAAAKVLEGLGKERTWRTALELVRPGSRGGRADSRGYGMMDRRIFLGWVSSLGSWLAFGQWPEVEDVATGYVRQPIGFGNLDPDLSRISVDFITESGFSIKVATSTKGFPTARDLEVGDVVQLAAGETAYVRVLAYGDPIEDLRAGLALAAARDEEDSERRAALLRACGLPERESVPGAEAVSYERIDDALLFRDDSGADV